MEEMTRERAQALMREGDFERAAAILKELNSLDPTDAMAWQMLGVSLGSLGRSAEAVGAFQKAVELQPSSARAQFNLAVALQKSERTSEARSHLEKALALDPGYEQARARLKELGGTPAPAPVAPAARPAPVAPPAGPASPSSASPAAPSGSLGGPVPMSAPAPPPAAPPPASVGGGLSGIGGLAPIGGGLSSMGGAPLAPAPPAAAPGGSSPGGMSGIGGPAPLSPSSLDVASGTGVRPPAPILAPPPSAGPGGYAPPPAAYAPPPSLGYRRSAPDVEASKALTYAIVGFFCFGIILGPIAISMATRGLSVLDEYGDADQSQRGTLNAARICGIIATTLSILGIVIRLATLGSSLGGARH